MRLTLAALLAAAVWTQAAPALACDSWSTCVDGALADDLYPPRENVLPPSVQILVRARRDGGLSLAGFYNDPSLALGATYGGPPLRRAY